MPTYHVTIGALRSDGTSAFERYAATVEPLIAEYGGTIVARGARAESLEGDNLPGFFAVIAFADVPRIHQFLDDPRYQTVIPTRAQAFAVYQTFIAQS